VFVDFTAAWCLTCQVNKAVVLDKESTQAFFKEKGIRLLLADWTNSDPVITAALEKQGRIGVPLYLAYLPGEEKPRVLPQILTPDNLREAFL
jgi:thiol:disulfide interchange protein